MEKLFWITAAVALLGIFLCWNTRPVSRSHSDVEETLERWLDGSLKHGEWDYFESCRIKNPGREKIRQRCVELSIDPEYTVEPRIGAALNEKGRRIVRGFVEDIKSVQETNAI